MVKITSDSTADLEELFEKRNIAVMPLNILLDGICYIDGETIKPQKISVNSDLCCFLSARA